MLRPRERPKVVFWCHHILWKTLGIVGEPRVGHMLVATIIRITRPLIIIMISLIQARHVLVPPRPRSYYQGHIVT